MSRSTGAVILFDGVCNLCNGFVRFVIERDPSGWFRFGALQSPEALALLASAGAPGRGGSPLQAAPETVVLVEDGRAYTQSTAVLRVVRRLRFPWPLASVFAVVPRPLRDLAYRMVARRRYRWFGRRPECMIPTPEIRRRFIH